MKKEFFNDEFIKAVTSDGWEVLDSGETRNIDYNKRCLVVAKTQKIAEIFKTPASKTSKKPVESRDSGTPPKTVMVNSRDGGGCSSSVAPISSDSKPLTDFEISLPYSLSLMRSSEQRLVIRAEPFWFSQPDNVISYNLSVVIDDYVLTAIFFVFSDVVCNLSIDYLLGRFLDCFLLSARYDRRNVVTFEYIPYLTPSGKPKVCCSTAFKDAQNHAAFYFDCSRNVATSIPKDKPPKVNSTNYKLVRTTCDYKSHDCIPITLLLNFGLKFFSSVDTVSKYSSNLLKLHCNIITDLHHGIFTSQSFNHFICSYVCSGWNHCYLLNIDIRDAVCLNCCGNDNSVPEIYGKYCDCYQYDFNVKGFEGNFKKLLDKYLAFCPLKYLQYACAVNNNILIFQSRIWGINRSMPCTVTSAACKVAQDFISKDLCCSNIIAYYRIYSGVKEVSSKLRLTLQNQFARNSVCFPINDNAETVQRFGSLSYTGGCNACFSVDVHHGHKTFDVDICSAYPTAMMLVPAIDYSNPIARELPKNHILTLDDFVVDGRENPMLPLFAKITYRFPHNCLFPNLKRNSEEDDKAPCYPLEENNPVYCSGPELYVALKMGAEITIVSGVVANVLKDNIGKTVYPYRYIVSELVAARSEAANAHGKNCLEAKLYKFIINSLYGKIAQNVHDMYSPDKTRANNAESLITNNVSASLITSFTRSVLFASFCGIHESGYHVYSATTDGLITDMPFEKFNTLPLFGLRECLTESRMLITDESNPKVWEVKHEQTDLLNITTRGNASLTVADPEHNILGGVIAHNGAGSENPDLPKESFANRKAFILSVASRTGKIAATYKQYTLLSEMQKTNCPYTESSHIKCLSMDFDMKRKPLRESLATEWLEIDGKSYEIAHIETVPFENNAEYLLYKTVADKQKCLRTVADWLRFFNDIDCASVGVASGPREDENYRWRCFKDCIAGHRAGIWNIPYLDTPGLTVAQKVEWLQSINDCPNHIFNRKTWDKLSEKSYIKKLLPYDILEETLARIVSLSPVTEVKNLETDLKDNESDVNNTTPCVSSITVSEIETKPEKYLEIDGVKMYFDDENEELLNESLDSPYFDNPYADDEDDSFNDSHTFEIYDGDIPDSLDYDDDFDDEPDVDYDSMRYISKTFDVSNNNTSKSDNSDVNLDRLVSRN